ncbi:MAG: hypothetical protein E6K52_07075 [Gammaproteobacteria bacterium]|nr:MAG: hypothetical protein E6K52_07075 [Gammaproteobacteria bacterium]
MEPGRAAAPLRCRGLVVSSRLRPAATAPARAPGAGIRRTGDGRGRVVERRAAAQQQQHVRRPRAARR